jgi:hypothetical protein
MEHWVVVAPIVAIAARVGAAAARNCPAATVDTGTATNTPYPRLYKGVFRDALFTALTQIGHLFAGFG